MSLLAEELWAASIPASGQPTAITAWWLLRYMILSSPGQDVVIPRVGGLTEPLHAIYSKRCLRPIERVLAAGGLKIVSFFPEVRVRYVEEQEISLFDPQCLSFFNINTPGDLEKARNLARRG